MKNKTFLSAALAFFMLAGFNQTTQAITPQMPSEETVSKCKVAPTPPMGWNSFDAYDCRINEQEFKAIVDYMAANLKQHGWEYAVIDYCWFNDNPGGWNNPSKRYGHPDIRLDKDGKPLDVLCMDEYSRLIPSVKRFPSAANGKGFKPLADYVHSKGMKFGIHIMRGIARQAYFQKSKIMGSKATAYDIAEPFDTCNWCNNMYGVDASKEGAQEYYNSIFKLYAEWGVDFIKADDTMYPPYHKGEIEMMRKAIENCGRPMVLSLSCGEAPLGRAEHIKKNATMWRVSADFWDNWEDLYHNFDLLNAWSSHIGEDSWPDADMIPFGKLALQNRPVGKERMSRFTPEEYNTLMTLFCMARSPLMIGADLLSTPKEIIDKYFKNDEILAIDQHSTDNRQVFKNKSYAIWTATVPETGERYIALFNLQDKPATVTFNMELESLRGKYQTRDLWKKQNIGIVEGKLSAQLGAHDATVFKLTKVK